MEFGDVNNYGLLAFVFPIKPIQPGWSSVLTTCCQDLGGSNSGSVSHFGGNRELAITRLVITHALLYKVQNVCALF